MNMLVEDQLNVASKNLAKYLFSDPPFTFLAYYFLNIWPNI